MYLTFRPASTRTTDHASITSATPDRGKRMAVRSCNRGGLPHAQATRKQPDFSALFPISDYPIRSRRVPLAFPRGIRRDLMGRGTCLHKPLRKENVT